VSYGGGDALYLVRVYFPVSTSSKENGPLPVLTAFPNTHRPTRSMSQDSAVGIVTNLGSGQSGVSAPGETRDFYLLQSLHIDSGVQPALLPTGTAFLLEGHSSNCVMLITHGRLVPHRKTFVPIKQWAGLAQSV
jgi:hypothetical protein